MSLVPSSLSVPPFVGPAACRLSRAPAVPASALSAERQHGRGDDQPSAYAEAITRTRQARMWRGRLLSHALSS